MFIGILSVKLKVKSYAKNHQMAVQYWDEIAAGMDLTPINEKQLRDRFKKSVISFENQQRLFFIYFLSFSRYCVISSDKIMNKAKGLVWRKKQKDQGIITKGHRGIDRDATWCKSKKKRLGILPLQFYTHFSQASRSTLLFINAQQCPQGQTLVAENLSCQRSDRLFGHGLQSRQLIHVP